MKSNCKSIEEIDQDAPASSASQLEPGLKRNVSVKNKLPSKSKRRKWDDDYIKHEVFRPRSEESRHQPSAQCMLNVKLFFLWVTSQRGQF